MSFTVAIDGPAAAGKGTLAKQLAAHFSMAHLDTGLLYRAVARQVLAGSDPVAAAVSLQAEDLDPTGLYTPEVAQQASRVAVLVEVRSALVAFQRNFAQRAEGAVLDGRDIGTVICCDAKVKLFVTARVEVRASKCAPSDGILNSKPRGQTSAVRRFWQMSTNAIAVIRVAKRRHCVRLQMQS